MRHSTTTHLNDPTISLAALGIRDFSKVILRQGDPRTLADEYTLYPLTHCKALLQQLNYAIQYQEANSTGSTEKNEDDYKIRAAIKIGGTLNLGKAGNPSKSNNIPAHRQVALGNSCIYAGDFFFRLNVEGKKELYRISNKSGDFSGKPDSIKWALLALMTIQQDQFTIAKTLQIAVHNSNCKTGEIFNISITELEDEISQLDGCDAAIKMLLKANPKTRKPKRYPDTEPVLRLPSTPPPITTTNCTTESTNNLTTPPSTPTKTDCVTPTTPCTPPTSRSSSISFFQSPTGKSPLHKKPREQSTQDEQETPTYPQLPNSTRKLNFPTPPENSSLFSSGKPTNSRNKLQRLPLQPLDVNINRT